MTGPMEHITGQHTNKKLPSLQLYVLVTSLQLQTQLMQSMNPCKHVSVMKLEPDKEEQRQLFDAAHFDLGEQVEGLVPTQYTIALKLLMRRTNISFKEKSLTSKSESRFIKSPQKPDSQAGIQALRRATRM